MQDSHFQTLYKRLNKAQKQAVDAIDGPVMVIAGPGTGKTSILTLRIANILKQTDTAPENILALTFTESGAYAMRKKLVEIIGVAAYKVKISTFHGFCNDVIKEYPERFPRIIGSTAITEIDQIAIMEKIIGDTKLELLKPFGDPMFYVRPVLGEIRKLKREAISPDDFKHGIEKQIDGFNNEPEKVHVKGAHKGKMKGEFVKLQEQIEKNKELLKLYQAYEKALLEQKYYDFEDMIVEVVKTLKSDSDLLLILQEQFQYILADEHQDANNAQNAILELLSNFHDNPNLFIVGDEKQAIFRFQGASLENFLYFKKLYPKAVLIHLEENYRSTQAILDASHSLISNNAGEEIKRVQLVARAQKEKQPIRIYEFPDLDAEHAFVAKEIERKIKEGTRADEIAVLYRNNNDSFAVAYALEKLGIPFRVESDNDILKDAEIRKLLILLESVNDLASEEFLARVLFIDFIGLSAYEAYKALETVRAEKKKLFEVVGIQFPELSKKLNSWASLAHNKQFIEVFETVVSESGFLAHALKSDQALEHLATLEAFFDEIRKLAGARKEYYLKDFIIHLNRVREHGILTKTGLGMQKEGVRLMTAHRSKGLEFDYVYIVGAYDGHWGNKSMRSYFHVPLTAAASAASIDDERRLFYVALTRARREVAITYSREGNEGRELLPAQFLGEIDEKLKSFTTISERVPIHQHFTRVNKITKVDNRDYLQKLFMEQGLSVTHLNNYIKCPWEYFFVNLIRVPKAQSKHQMYGTAVHYTLKTFFDKYRIEEDMKRDEMLRLFEFNLNKMPLPPRELEETLEKGRESLGGYYDQYKNTWPRRLLNEYNVKGVHLETPIGEVLLKGNLDKIEFIDDSKVHVVDYKTGKPKSKIDENYQRQLVFYKLILDLEKKYEMVSGELDFVEPDDKGKFKKFRYEVSDIEIKNLVETVKKVSEEIYNLSFWNTTCEEKDCEYCALAKHLK
jgi:DNA helicase II / ATP-dependent DNA helicase PcrA